jgi:MFS family permease
MRYLSEFGAHWRPLLAAGMGLAFGIAIANYTTSLFGPPLVAEFGWERSSFALLGMMGLVTLISMPIAGRLTDLFGVRRIAAIGVISLPLIFLAFSMMSGDITHFFLLSIAQSASRRWLGSPPLAAFWRFCSFQRARAAAPPARRSRNA